MLPMYLGFLGLVGDGHDYSWIIAPYLALIAGLMVSRIPTYSGKTFGSRIPREMVLPVLVVVVFTIFLLIAYPWQTLTIISLAYIAMLPVGIRSWRRLKYGPQATPAPPARMKRGP
jgi:CDP-diacylglycerol--serine O-phosphatidyltransferase